MICSFAQMEYNIEIKETLIKQVKVIADSEKAAIREVCKKYKGQQIVLDDSNFVDYEIHVVDNQSSH